ncbi:multifunctional oxoglutarate decarboxylase/oxoglutarate dehydrogenase thiamine pyrophosphate-binding subunit/dihydrolipoyllysine-residue succinyltransferase subunit, partial [Blastococcus sp. CT_GayMR20]
MSSVSSSRPSSSSSSSVAGFGTNEWLVEEMYQQYLADPSTVDQAWHEFFADYRPGSPVGGQDREQAAPAANGAAGQAAKKAAAAPAPAEPAAPPAAAAQAPSAPAAPPADPTAKPADKPAAKPAAGPVAAGKQSPLRGAAAAVVKNMNVSLTVPTATS